MIATPANGAGIVRVNDSYLFPNAVASQVEYGRSTLGLQQRSLEYLTGYWPQFTEQRFFPVPTWRYRLPIELQQGPMAVGSA